MSLVRWDPFSDLVRLHNEVDRLFRDNYRQTGREPAATRHWAPAVDIEDTGEALTFHVELAGVKPEDVHIELEGGTLTIRGERKGEIEKKEKSFVRIERVYGSFLRTFELGMPVKRDDVKATYNNGMLEIVLPKAEEIKPKTIEVKIEQPVNA